MTALNLLRGPFWMEGAEPIPAGLWPKVLWILNATWWIPLLLAGEQLLEAHYLNGGICFFLFVMCVGAIFIWGNVRRRQVAWGFIIVGAICLALGIYLLESTRIIPDVGERTERSGTVIGAAEKPTTPPSPPAKPKVPLSAYDQEKKLRLIDEQIMPVLKGDMVRVIDRANDLSNWQGHINDQDKFGTDLNDLFDLYNRTAQRLGAIRQEHEQYGEDIGQLLNQDYQGPLIEGMRDYRQGIAALGKPPTGDYAFFLNPLSEKFRIGIAALAKWRHDRETRLYALRKEIGG
jgi:hypothetical protein